mgnify:CR=1 FL=1
MESWVSLGGKESRTNQFKYWIELGTLWSEDRDLTNCANHARPRSFQNAVFINDTLESTDGYYSGYQRRTRSYNNERGSRSLGASLPIFNSG